MTPHLSALRISFLYLVAATFWVWLGGQWLHNALLDPASLAQAMELKKVGFLAVTFLLLFCLLWPTRSSALAVVENGI